MPISILFKSVVLDFTMRVKKSLFWSVSLTHLEYQIGIGQVGSKFQTKTYYKKEINDSDVQNLAVLNLL